MSIATGRGDTGTTQLLFGPRVSKGSPRVESYGTIDELGAFIGLARAFCAEDPLAPRLEALQRALFVIGAELASPPDRREGLTQRIDAARVTELQHQVDELEAVQGILTDWALPGATPVGSYLDVARTVCRRAERQVVRLVDAGDEDNLELLRWLNRLGDLLWLYARWYEARVGVDAALRRK